MEIRANKDDYNVHDKIIINNVTLYGIKNVKTYNFIDFDGWKIDTAPDSSSNTEAVYLIIDTKYNMAFAHWVFESAIYLELYHTLQKRHPHIKIVMDVDLSYKHLFYKYFNIDKDAILHHVYDYRNADVNIVIHTLDNSNNICYFPKPITSFNDRTITDEYKSHIMAFWSTFHKAPVEKTIDILLLPRQAKENYKGNDRITDTSNIEKRLATITNNYRVLHTDNNTELLLQIELVQKAKVIIVTDGSPYSVNGFFAKDSKIILLGDITQQQIPLYPKVEFIHKLICSHNTVINIPYSAGGRYKHSVFTLEHILPYL